MNPEQIEAELAHLTDYLPGRIDTDLARAEIEESQHDAGPFDLTDLYIDSLEQ